MDDRFEFVRIDFLTRSEEDQFVSQIEVRAFQREIALDTILQKRP